jgi:hypothetical protein
VTSTGSWIRESRAMVIRDHSLFRDYFPIFLLILPPLVVELVLVLVELRVVFMEDVTGLKFFLLMKPIDRTPKVTIFIETMGSMQ